MPKITPQNRLARWHKTWPKLKPLQFVTALHRQFPAARVYLVGGMVRDLAIGRPTTDYDLVVANVPSADLERTLGELGTVDLVGKTFGVFKFVPRDGDRSRAIDVALPRTEHAFGTGGYRDVQVQSDHTLPIENDLARRDFTVNAIALELASSSTPNIKKIKNLPPTSYKLLPRLIDPHGGMDDLSREHIRAVGDPGTRFQEDYSRILRAIRFSCQLDFEIEAKTWTAVRAGVPQLNRVAHGERVVPHEVIAKELVKAVVAQPAWALELLDESGVLQHLMPELLKMKGCPQPPQFHSEGDVWTHTVLAFGKLDSAGFQREFPRAHITPELVWAVLFHDVGKPPTLTVSDRIRTNGHDVAGAKIFRQVADRLKLSSAGLQVDAIEQLVAKHLLSTHAKRNEMKETTIEKYFFNDQFPGEQLLQLTYVDIAATVPPSGRPDFETYRILKRRINALRERLSAKRRLPKALLDGHAIMALLKIPPGPQVQQAKDYLREEQLAGRVRTTTQAQQTLCKRFGPPRASPKP
ncbi:MAG: HD domain-containing protein [bacterium]|nr:HD domain-containing protein [bacterium]